jgi:hypothetical protein
MAIGSGPAGRRWVDVRAVPAFEAGAVLNRRSVIVGNVLVTGTLLVFFGSVACLLIAASRPWLVGEALRWAPAAYRLPLGVGSAVACLVVSIVSGYIGLKNAGVPGNLYYQWLARRQVARRRNKVVDPARPGDVPIRFVQVVPRANWGRLMLETATDTVFLQIDRRRRELRFEGDVEQFVVPGDAITSCDIEDYAASKGQNGSKIVYSVVVLRGYTAAGPWEAPISLRQTQWFVPPDHRRQAAEAIRGDVLAILPAGWMAEEPTGDDLPDDLLESDDGTPAGPGLLAAAKRSRSSGTPVPRIILIAVAIALGLFRGWYRSHHPSGSAGTSTRIPYHGGDDPELAMTVTNVRHGQRVTTSRPFVSDGGPWTVFTCAPVTDPTATFDVAIRAPGPTTGPVPVAFSQATLVPSDRAAGGRVVDALTKAFNRHTPLPTTRPATALRPVQFETVIMAEQLSSPAEGLRAGHGNWVATKWFLNDGDDEVFFNYDLAGGRAVFGEKDEDYDDGVIAALATALRDGSPLPEATTKP